MDRFCDKKAVALIRWSRDLNRSCVAEEYLYLFSTQIPIRWRPGTGFTEFKHAGLLADLFNLCQLHISYTKYVKLSRSFIMEKVCHYLPSDMGERGYNEKSY